MAEKEFDGLDAYEAFLTETLTPWPPPRRVALAAALAERWLPAYEAFSAEEEWGDPAALRRSLEAIWGHVMGRTLTGTDVARQAHQIDEITPHLDDFDAADALTACLILKDALRCCGDAEEAFLQVVCTARGAFEGLTQGWPDEPAAERQAWRKSTVRKELQAQLQLVEEIGALTTVDEAAVKALRGRLARLKVKPAAKPKPKGPPALINQTAFEQYRRMVEADLKRQVTGGAEPEEGSYSFAITYLAYWLGRYSRRRQTLDGSYGRLADQAGVEAVLARNRSLDAAALGPLEWAEDVRKAVALCLKNNSMLKVLDAATIETPHAFGPSLRRLWLEGRRQGQSARDGWANVRAWGGHRPAAWAAEDRRKKKGKAYVDPDLRAKLTREITWTATGDPFHPWAAEVEGVAWRVRVNDFPDDLMYSLIAGEEAAGDFNDWPAAWRRDP